MVFKKWFGAMKFEIDYMYINKVNTLVNPPEGIKLIRCKGVFKRKTDIDDNVKMYKVR
jgi:hypothetical protein